MNMNEIVREQAYRIAILQILLIAMDYEHKGKNLKDLIKRLKKMQRDFTK